MRLLVLLTTLCILFACAAGAAASGCPDEIKCKQWYTDDLGKSHQITIGTMSVPCCYDFPSGCRPWHCDGVKDRGYLGNKEYWARQCNERFPDCTRTHAGYTQDSCWPHYVTF